MSDTSQGPTTRAPAIVLRLHGQPAADRARELLASRLGGPVRTDTSEEIFPPQEWPTHWGTAAHEHRRVSPRTIGSVDAPALRISVLDLPRDVAASADTGEEAGTIVLAFPRELTNRVLGALSPEAILLAAWQAMLSRLCDADRVPVARGTRIVCADFSDQPAALDLLARPQAEQELSQHQVAFAFEDLSDLLTGLDAEVWVHTGTIAADLAFTVRRAGHALAGEVVFRRSAFTGWLAGRIGRWLLTFLDAMLADPSVPVHEIALEPFTGPVLRGPVADFPVHRPIHRFIEDQVDAVGGAVAVVAPDRTVTYDELERRANRIAHRLTSLGVCADQPVAVLLEASADLVCAMVAILKAGGAYLPLDAGYPAARVDDIMRSAGARVVLTVREFAARATAPERMVLTLDEAATLAGQPDDRPDVAVRPNHLHHVIFTSGSTGTPKGVAVEHRSVVNYVHAVLERLGDVAGKSFAVISTPAADFGLTCVFGALVTGGAVHLIAREVATAPDEFAAYLLRHHVEVLKCVPSHLELLITHPDIAAVLPRELLVMSGEPCPWPLVEKVWAARPDLRVQSHYGHTESTMVSFVCETDSVPPQHRSGLVPLGTPLANLAGHLVDRFGRPLPVGIPGELVMTGPGVSRGYLGRPELTADRFFPDPTGCSGRCYRSGDRLRIDAEGTLRFVGRVDDQIKIRGHRVEPGEVSSALRMVPGVIEAVVLAVGEGLSRKLAAWVVAVPDLDPAAVRAVLRTRLPEHMIPSAIAVLDRMPLTANGKIDRSMLVLPAATAPGGPEPRTPSERAIAAAWESVLDVTGIGPFDDFFALGGDSLAAVRATRALGSGMRVIDLSARPTVAELAELLDHRERRQARLLHRFHEPVGTFRTTLICIPYGGGSGAAFQGLSAALLVHEVAVLAVELPGHDPARPDEPLLPLAELVPCLADEILCTVEGPVALYGHCVGTAAAIEVAHTLTAAGRPPVGVVVAGGLPDAPLPGRTVEALTALFGSHRWSSDETYRDALRATGGLPPGMAPEDVRAAVRGTRHDARQAALWFARELPAPRRLATPVLCVVGEGDRVTDLYEERHHEWRPFTERLDLAVLPDAGHYFVSHQPAELAATIGGWLAGSRAFPTTAPHAEPNLRIAALAGAGHLFALLAAVIAVATAASDLPIVSALLALVGASRMPVGRALADRADSRCTLTCCDLGIAAGIGCLIASPGNVAATALVTFAAAIRQPVWFAVTRRLVPKTHRAQIRFLGRRSWGPLCAVGGGFFALTAATPLVALILAAAATMISLGIQPPDLRFRQGDEPFRRALVGGIRFLRGRASLRGLLVLRSLSLAACGVAIAIAAHHPPGLLLIAGGLGWTAGLISATVRGFGRRMVGVLVSLACLGVVIAFSGLVTGPAATIAAALLAGTCAASLDEHWSKFAWTETGEQFHGRIRALGLTSGSLALAAGLVVGAWSDTTASLVITGGALVAAAVAGTWWWGAEPAVENTQPAVSRSRSGRRVTCRQSSNANRTSGH